MSAPSPVRNTSSIGLSGFFDVKKSITRPMLLMRYLNAPVIALSSKSTVRSLSFCRSVIAVVASTPFASITSFTTTFVPYGTVL